MLDTRDHPQLLVLCCVSSIEEDENYDNDIEAKYIPIKCVSTTATQQVKAAVFVQCPNVSHLQISVANVVSCSVRRRTINRDLAETVTSNNVV